MDIASFNLDGNADAVEFCPHYPFHHILAVATYTLEEGNEPNRSGSISLFSADADVGLELLHQIQTAGVFDIKWSPSGTNAHPLLAQADADGCLSLHSLHSSGGTESNDGNADAVEFCPHYHFHHILAVATYTLEEGNEPNRSGSISLFSADADVGLELRHHVQTAGVFDIKWSPSGTNVHPLLAQADADGCLSLHSLHSIGGTEVHGTVLKEVCSEKISSSMCLCADWSPSAGSISLGLSDGSISTIIVGESQLQRSQSWVAHEYEVWATSFDTHQPQLLYTGSDDCCFSCWDLRESPSKLAFQNAKSHKMGVCCISQGPTSSDMLLTGSYDEFLRVWDVRSTSKPVEERALCLGGGVWRIKHHPHAPGLVLAACMHNGFAVLKLGDGDVSVAEVYRKHESLAYGADWHRGGVCSENGSGRGSLVATCSFYDRLLRIWKPESLMVK